MTTVVVEVDNERIAERSVSVNERRRRLTTIGIVVEIETTIARKIVKLIAIVAETVNPESTTATKVIRTCKNNVMNARVSPRWRSNKVERIRRRRKKRRRSRETVVTERTRRRRRKRKTERSMLR